MRVRYRTSDGFLIGLNQDWPPGDGEAEIVIDPPPAVRETPRWAWRVDAGTLRAATDAERQAARLELEGSTPPRDWQQVISSVAFGALPAGVQLILHRFARLVDLE